MPTYEYKCTQEGTKFEIWQEVGAEAPPCPTCGAASKKVFSPTRTIFKGSGFYVTDLRAEKSASQKSSADSSAKNETAPAAAETPAPSETTGAAAPTAAAATDAPKA